MPNTLKWIVLFFAVTLTACGASGESRTLPTAVALTVSPGSIQALIGETVAFQIALPDRHAAIQWQMKHDNETDAEWKDIGGATDATLTVVTTKSYMFCEQYRAVVIADGAVTISSVSRLVNQLAPPVFKQNLPAEITVTEGESAIFAVATDDASFYRWLKNGEYVEDGSWTPGTYTTAPLTSADNGARFQVEAVHFAGNHQCTQAGESKSREVVVRVISAR